MQSQEAQRSQLVWQTKEIKLSNIEPLIRGNQKLRLKQFSPECCPSVGEAASGSACAPGPSLVLAGEGGSVIGVRGRGRRSYRVIFLTGPP